MTTEPNDTRAAFTPSFTFAEPRRKWIVYINSKRVGEVLAPSEDAAKFAARGRWRMPSKASLKVAPKCVIKTVGRPNKAGTALPSSNKRDAQIILAARMIKGWTRPMLEKLAGVRQIDMNDLACGRSSGAVKQAVFRVLTEAGIDLDALGEVVDKANACVDRK